MKQLISKEFRLAATKLSYFFVASALLTLAPGYPILLGGFFTVLGIFYSFQTMRENRDIDYSLILPVSKADIVKSKFVFTIILEGCSFLIMTILTVIRMTILKDAEVYRANALMGANLVFLGFVLILFGFFNFCFVRGFFRTGYYIGKPFVMFCVFGIILISLAEALHHIPGLEMLNSFGFDNIVLQCIALAIGILGYAVLTFTAVRCSVKRFETIDI